MTDPQPDRTDVEPAPGRATRERVWIVLPTYNEAENVEPMAAADPRGRCPAATVLVVDDGSPDGTGQLADALAAADPRIRVRHRPLKQGLGRAYLDGFGVALAGGATTVVQMDADFSHDPAALPGLVAPDRRRHGRPRHRVALHARRRRSSTGGSAGGSCRAAGACSRGSSSGCGQNDLTGGFKAWRATTLAAVPFDGVHAGGYVFQIEMTFRASRAGARIREVPITFRDRRVGQSKMSRRIVVEALVVVVQLRAEELARPPDAAAADRDPSARADGRLGGRDVRDRRARPASAWSSTRGRSRRPIGRRWRRPTWTACSGPSTRRRSPASRSRS